VKAKTLPIIQKTKLLELVVFCELWVHLPWLATTIWWSCPLHCKFLLVPFDICVLCWLMMKLISFSSSFDLFCEQVGLYMFVFDGVGEKLFSGVIVNVY